MDVPYPDGIEERHLSGGPAWAGWLPMLVLGAVIVVALFGLLGGGLSAVRAADSPAARLTINTPLVMRQGVLFETRILAEPRRPIRDLQIGITPALWRDFTINTLDPEPSDETYKDGLFRLSYGAAEPGRPFEIKVDGQINPSLPTTNRGEIVLFDGETRLVAVPMRIRVLP